MVKIREAPPVIFAFSPDPTTLRGVGIPAWVWFAVAAVAIGTGVVLLISGRSQRASKNRERHRWAALRGWQFAELDQVLPTRWERGWLAQFSGVVGADVVAGTTFTADGRRPVYALDLVVNGRTLAVLAGVRCRRSAPTTVELWLPDVPVPQDSGLDLLGPVGSRYAFVTDLTAARPMITRELAEVADHLGADVTVAWLENDWVLAAADPGADPERLERLLRTLGELADLVDPFEVDPNEHEVREDERHLRAVDDLDGLDPSDLDAELDLDGPDREPAKSPSTGWSRNDTGGER